jgi:hypothetical protein
MTTKQQKSHGSQTGNRSKTGFLPSPFSLLPFLALFIACEQPVQETVTDWQTRVRQSGTPISTAEQLAKIGLDIEYPRTGEYYLVNDIDLSAIDPWIAIGPEEALPFGGKFLGEGYTISGLKLDGSDERIATGLFGYITGAYVDDVTLVLANSKDDVLEFGLPEAYPIAAAMKQNVGVFAGQVDSSSLTNIRLKAAESSGLSAYFGEYGYSFFVGALAGEFNRSEAINIESDIPISMSMYAKNTGIKPYTGGIVGAVMDSTLKSISAAGNITVVASGLTTPTTGGIVGGTLGGDTSLFEDLLGKFDSITAKITTATVSIRLGGLIGDFSGSLKRASFAKAVQIIADASVESSATVAVYVGGVSGYGTGTIEDCSIDVPLDITVTYGGQGALLVGGFSGLGQIFRSSITGTPAKITVNRTTAALGAPHYTRIGGLTASGNVSDSFSFCDITVNAKTSSGYANTDHTAVGGLAGFLASANVVTNSYFAGKIEFKNNSESGTAAVGGIGGLVYSVATSKVLNCAVVGSAELKITGGSIGTNYVSGIANKIGAGTVSDNIVATSANISDGTTNETITGKTAVESTDNTKLYVTGTTVEGPLTQAMFDTTEGGLGWDFAKVWKWDSGLNLPVHK